jgi:hypothetical protein
MTWKTLCHPNVLPLLGVKMDNKQFVMVSEWMENGNINEFVKTHKDVNRFELVGFFLSATHTSLKISSDSSRTSLRG